MLLYFCNTQTIFNQFTLEKYPRGRRGSPAKGVVRESVARVQIPLSPPPNSVVSIKDMTELKT